MPTWLLYTLGVVIFAVGLLLSIALHEIGHMVPAKKFGVKVTQYMVGFGPTLWSRKRGDTEYGLKAIPVGGYIRMIGMVPPRADGKRSRWPRRMATAIEDFRQVSRAEVEPEDADRQFYRLTPGKKMIVMLGGPCMNLVIYLVLTTILLLTFGTAHNDPTTTVASVVKCVVPANSQAATSDTCPDKARKAPALHKLHPGDRIVSANGTPIHSWDQLVGIIQPNAAKQLTLVVAHHGVERTVKITPVLNKNYKGNTDKIVKVGYLGIEPGNHHYYTPLSITGVPGQIGSQINLGVHALGQYPAKVANLWGAVFDGQKRDVNGAVGIVGIGRISGDYASSTALTLEDKIVTLLGLLASVNLLLFFFNLLPLLPLDGGHVAGAIVESIKRGRARLRARSLARDGGLADDGDPGAAPAHRQIFVDTAQMLPVMYGVASVLVLLTLLTLWADIVKPINPLGG